MRMDLNLLLNEFSFKKFAGSVVLVLCLIYITFRVFEQFKVKTRNTLPPRTILSLFMLFGLGLCSYFLSRQVLGNDAHTHLARPWLIADILSNGELPIWSNRWYLGFPIGLSYGFFYYLLCGIIIFLTGFSAVLTTKLLLFLLHILSGFAFFHIAFLCCKNRNAALFASMFYVFSFQHIGTIILAGSLHLSIMFLLLPLLFVTLERVNGRNGRDLLYYSILAAGLISCLLLTHVEYGTYAVVCFSLVVLVRVAGLLFQKNRVAALTTSKFLCLTGVIALIFCAWYLVPFLVEKKHLMFGSENILKNIIIGPSLSQAIYDIRRILIPSRTFSPYYYYFGLVPVAFSLIGTLGVFSKRMRSDSRYLGYALALIISSVFAVLSKFVNVWFFLVCLMSTWGFVFVLESQFLKRLRRSLQDRVALILLVLLLIDCGMTLVHKVGYQLPSYDLPDTAAHHGRLQALYGDFETLWSSLDVIVTDRSTLFGGIPESSPKPYPYVAAICMKSAIDLLDRNEDIDSLTRDAFRMLNVSYLVVPDRHRVITFDRATPAMFAPQAIRGRPDEAKMESENWKSIIYKFDNRTLDYAATDDIIRRMGISYEKPVMHTVIMHPDISPKDLSALNSQPLPSAGTADFAVLKSDETPTTLEMEYTCSSPGIIQLAYSYFPFLKVKIDGKAVSTYQSALGLMVLRAPAGRHLVSIEAGVSPLRSRLFWIGISGLCLFSIYALFHAIRRAKAVRVGTDY